MRTIAFLLILAAAALADGPRVYTAADGAMPPRVIERSAPDYTPQAEMARLTGSVTVRLIVDEDGSLRDVHVSKPLGFGLDDKAVQAVRTWQFAPGIMDGKPAAVLTTVEVNFQLLTGRKDWRLTRASFDGPTVRLLSAGYPAPSGPEQYGAVTLSFDIDEVGVPRNVRVEKSTDQKWEAEVVDIAAQWRFEPGTKSHCTFEFTRGKPAA